jgi:uncharacterized SAM-binding protein YcdF (DUF218 family)
LSGDRPSASAADPDAIVVLGCALDRSGAPTPALERRTRHGVALHRAGAAPFLVLSGGGPHPRSEAAAMAEIARAAGIPEAAILLEDRSRNTFENAAFTVPLLVERGATRVVLVSDFYHLPRARLMFRLAGLPVAAVAAPPSPPLRRVLPMILREAAATALSLFLTTIGAHKRALRNKPLSERDR